MAGVTPSTIIDEICNLARQQGRRIRFLTEPLRRGRAITWIEQHWLRNQMLSAVLRPAWLSHCDDTALIEKTIQQMRQELVYDEAITRSHRQLLVEFAAAMGLSGARLEAVRPLVSSRVCFHVLENLARTQSWMHGWLATSLGEFLLLETDALKPETWRRAFGLSEADVFFLAYHQKADEDHAGREVWAPLLRHVQTSEQAGRLVAAAEDVLAALQLFYDGIVAHGDARADLR